MSLIGVEMFRLERPRLAADDVWRLLGLRMDKAARPGLAACVEETLEWCRAAKIHPRAVGGHFAVAALRDGRMILEENTEFAAPGWLFEGASHLFIGAATLGPEFEAESSRRFEAGDPAGGFILDAVASEELRCGVDAFYRGFRDRVRREGLTAGPKLFPGCHGIPLDVQKAVFGLLPAAGIGMALDGSLMMTPRKSVSFIVPYGGCIPEHIASLNACAVCEGPARCLTPRHHGLTEE